MIKELAKLKFENKFICELNLKYLQKKKELFQIFSNYLSELKKIKNYRIHCNITFYDVLESKLNFKKQLLLARNKEFLKSFYNHWNFNLFKSYSSEIYTNFKQIERKKKVFRGSGNRIKFSIKKLFAKFSFTKNSSF